MIRKNLIIFIIILMNSISAYSEEYTILQWNIWQEGTMVEGGYDAIVEEIHRINPDFVTLSEVRNYGGIDFTAKLTSDLKQRGDTFYTTKSYDTGLLSKFPIERFDTIFPLADDHGTIYRLHATSPSGDKFAVYTAHLDYQNCAYYEPRGYSGVDWKECAVPSSVEEILMKNDISLRDDAIKNFIAAGEEDIADGRIVFIGGDFNEPSLADWTEATSLLYDHKGFIVPWTVSLLLQEAHYIDSYRAIYPDPVEYPGFTYPSANHNKEISELTWAPKSDERERIDVIYYKSPANKRVELQDAYIFGPKESIANSQIMENPGKDKYITPSGIWPTDHKGLILKFNIPF